MLKKIIFAGLVAGVILILAAGILGWYCRDDQKLRARRELLTFKLLRVLPSESWTDIVRRVRPSSVRNPQGTLVLDAARVENPAAGELLFNQRCSVCHGVQGKGGTVGPSLSTERVQAGLSDFELYTILTRGIAGTNMPPSEVSVSDGLRLTAYVRTLRSHTRSVEPELKAFGSDCTSCASILVSSKDINGNFAHPEGWLSFSGDYTGQRFSPLSEVNKANVARLRPRFIYQLKSLVGLEVTPLVANSVMFLTGPENEVIALDLATGAPAWEYRRVIPAGVSLCCGRHNRGLALLGGRVFHNTLDAHLVALDVRTGKEIWNVEVADTRQGYSMTGAPLAIENEIIVGVAGGEFGARGFIDAYDADSGKKMWRFDTVPGPGRVGHESWKNDGWKRGGGPTWMTGTYDPNLHLLYWGVGNPSPDFNPQSRPGDNLYTCSVVALDPKTGELRWYYQFTPNDGNDWDANEVPVLVDVASDGVQRNLMFLANKNCFFYELDRKTGRFLKAGAFCNQNWNDGFSAEGRPIRRAGGVPSQEGPSVSPGVGGGANWPPPAYSPDTSFFYVKTYDASSRIIPQDPQYTPGAMFLGGRYDTAVPKTSVTAIDTRTATVAWRKTLDVAGKGDDKSGVLATQSGLLFTGDSDGRLLVFDAQTGNELWRYRLGGQIAMAPITYLYNRSQEVAVISAGALVVLDLVK